MDWILVLDDLHTSAACDRTSRGAATAGVTSADSTGAAAVAATADSTTGAATRGRWCGTRREAERFARAPYGDPFDAGAQSAGVV